MTIGDNTVYTIGTNGGATFVSVDHINDYLGTSINGIPIRLSDIRVKAGSTIVTISSEYMDTLPNGQHTVSMYSTKGTATAKFTVVGNKETPTFDKEPKNKNANLDTNCIKISVLICHRTTQSDTITLKVALNIYCCIFESAVAMPTFRVTYWLFDTI